MKKVTFKIPDYTPPEGMKEGDTFDVAATLKLDKNGELCLVKVDGVAMPGYEDKEKASEPAAEDAAVQADFAQRYQQAMAGGGMPAAEGMPA